MPATAADWPWLNAEVAERSVENFKGAREGTQRQRVPLKQPTTRQLLDEPARIPSGNSWLSVPERVKESDAARPRRCAPTLNYKSVPCALQDFHDIWVHGGIFRRNLDLPPSRRGCSGHNVSPALDTAL